MRKLGGFGSVVAALLMAAGTAYADPFTVTSNNPSTRGIDNAWFNNLIKLSGPPSAATKTYLADSIIIFGGELVAAPNGTITLTPIGTALAGFGQNILMAGAVDSVSWGGLQHMLRGNASNHGNVSTSVPGASAAYDPLTPSYPGLGIIVPHPGNSQGNLGGFFLFTPWFTPALGNAFGLNPNDPPFAFTLGSGGATVAATSLPATPEPSPLLLLAAGLVLALVASRYRPGLTLG